YLLQGRRLKECRQKQQSLTLSTLALGFLEKSAKHQFRSRVQAVVLFLIIPVIGTYFDFREVQLNADKRLLQSCPEKQEYCPGRREALERLVKAGESLPSLNLDGANLESADLDGAKLESAKLESAKLNNAKLEDANLNNANLKDANLNNANLNNAKLEGANLKDVNLIDTKNLTYAQIKLACYWDQAFYKGYYDEEKIEWIIDEEANKAYIEELKQDKASDPKTPPDCSKWE
ncbi:MAG: pentapeptide repeat-containing protein, partial [Crocosphaera sp.]